MNTDRPFLGILLMIAFCALAPIGDTSAKLLGRTVPLAEILLVRLIIQAVILLPLIWWSGRSLAMSRRHFWLATLRTVLFVAGIATMYTSLRFLPLANAVAIAFVMPFVLLMLGRLILKETVGQRRIIACLVGFAGTLFVVQPSFATAGPAAFLPLGVAVIFSLYILVSRQLARDVDAYALQAVGGVTGALGMGLIVLFGVQTPLPAFDLIVPDMAESLLLCLIGVLGTLAHLLMLISLRFAPAATLAPVQYMEIVFATFWGWLVFNDLPNALAGFGICVTAGAGLYIVFNERALARPIPAET